MAQLYTTLGPKKSDELGYMLAHEHIFVDLGPIEAESYRSAEADAVIEVMVPHLRAIAEQDITVLVECTPVGVGRRADIDVAVSQAAEFPVVLPTGIYREPWVPAWAHEASEDAIASWMIGELQEQVEETGVPAAWIKVSAGDDGMTACERKILRAAAHAGRETQAIIGSHTIRGRVALEQLAVIEEAGYRRDRFIWIHAQQEPDQALHQEVAGSGAWVEYDAIGSSQFSDRWFIETVATMVNAGFARQILLSQDRGWYDPSKPGGGEVKPFTYLVDTFLPQFQDAGAPDDLIVQLLRHNPFNAYAR